MGAELIEEMRPEIENRCGKDGKECDPGCQSPWTTYGRRVWLLSSRMLKMEGYLEITFSTNLAQTVMMMFFSFNQHLLSTYNVPGLEDGKMTV